MYDLYPLCPLQSKIACSTWRMRRSMLMRGSWRLTSGATHHRLIWSTLKALCKLVMSAKSWTHSFKLWVCIYSHQQLHDIIYVIYIILLLFAGTQPTSYSIHPRHCKTPAVYVWDVWQTLGQEQSRDHYHQRLPQGSERYKEWCVISVWFIADGYMVDPLLLRKHQEWVQRNDRESKKSLGSGRTEAQEP